MKRRLFVLAPILLVAAGLAIALPRAATAAAPAPLSPAVSKLVSAVITNNAAMAAATARLLFTLVLLVM